MGMLTATEPFHFNVDHVWMYMYVSFPRWG